MIQYQQQNDIFSFLLPQTVHVGIDTTRLNYIVAKQKESNWCWAASIETISKYYGLNVRQEDFAADYCGVDWNGRIKNCPAKIDIITKDLNQCYWNELGQITHCINAQVRFGRPDTNTLINCLTNNMPVILAYHGLNIGHAVILTAMSYQDTFFGRELKSLTVRDPSPVYHYQPNAGWLQYNMPDVLLDTVYAWWIPTVTKYPTQCAQENSYRHNSLRVIG